MQADKNSVSRWLPDLKAEDENKAGVRLFCFPYAGGGASVFRHWQVGLPSQIQVCRVQLPGRERRMQEPPHTNLVQLVREMLDALLPCFEEKPFAFYGHSMGTRIVFETALQIRNRTGLTPVHMFMAACDAVGFPERPPAHTLPDDHFVDVIRQLKGTPEEVLANEELMNIFLPLLRADYRLKETYKPGETEPFACPITAFSGADDAETCAAGMLAWSRHGNDLHLKTFNGGHFFLHTHADALLSEIGNRLTQHAPATSRSTTIHAHL
ncbi:thioesterase II family protein [Oleidesulfovibrio alaskensis]|jgi:medium-chain acyl-[acyl-carrier-protein] hydrolase|uniref:thioesterase II family protein n=1 Tax=Oleidesulfovibrio alaskensis TaxID=58180 RepID=UPI000412C46A|nr:alpha/beta fold hydrolase [Oleidesulfovibrio alaskensis]MBG0773344.1 thioesterase [Oleidesulfovibrio alaskensis]